MFNWIKKKSDIDYESLYHNSQETISKLIENLETKQKQCDIIETVAQSLREENKLLKDKVISMEKNLLDLPKLLGKYLKK